MLFVTHDIEEAIFMANRVVVMSARPGRIKADVAVDLPHPRHYTVKTTPEFSALQGAADRGDPRRGDPRDGAVTRRATPGAARCNDAAAQYRPPLRCQRQASAQIASSPRVARQPSSSVARDGSA